jgi:hypothetical protein
MFHVTGYDDPRRGLQIDAEAFRLILRLRLDWLSATSLNVIEKLVGLRGEGGNADTLREAWVCGTGISSSTSFT